jgi:hypothetical protein
MATHWPSLQTLQHGTPTQQAAYGAWQAMAVFDLLQAYDPVLAGTIPLDVDVPGSDLDIICCCADPAVFASEVQAHFGHYAAFTMRQYLVEGLPTVVANFVAQGFAVEVFGQGRPVMQQTAVRHMLVERALLAQHGDALRAQVRSLKATGLKTEPAFAQALGLPGDPYQTLLAIYDTLYGANKGENLP